MGINISGLGIANAIGFKPRVDGGRRFLPPNIKSSLVSVISTYGKKNTDSDRNILKDKTGKGNDFKLLNFGFTGNSGYGMYKTNFLDYTTYTPIVRTYNKIVVTGVNIYLDWWVAQFKSPLTPPYKVKISGTTSLNPLRYHYKGDDGKEKFMTFPEDGVYTLPTNIIEEGDTFTYGFLLTYRYDEELIKATIGLTIEQLPDFEGWLCTDGIDDLIVSVKPVSEMLEGSNEITVVSIIHQISNMSDTTRSSTNNIRSTNDTFGARNLVELQGMGKTGIYGYTCANIKVNSPSLSIVNSILGDKNDYSCSGINFKEVDTLSIQGFINQSDGSIKEVSQIAYAGGFIANKVLTTDEINQVIAYYNLDRPGKIIKPSMLYDIRKQGITNVNHAEFNDELIDYINGYNIKMYNMLWDKQSGIGNYPISFKDYTYLPARATVEVNKDNFVITANTSASNFLEINTKTKSLPTYKVKIEGTSTITNGKLGYRLNTVDGTLFYKEILKDGEYEIPEFLSTETDTYSGWCITGGFNDSMNVKITLLAIDDITDAIVLDGISNFGKVTNVPIWKDYTICALRKWLSPKGDGGGLISKSKIINDGAFMIEQSVFNVNSGIYTYSFGLSNKGLSNPDLFNKNYVYQTRYSYNGNSIQAGTGVDSNSMWLGTPRDKDTRFAKLALWSLMLFPYSLSKFLLERQLKKYKLGSLYDKGMVIWRPEVTSNNSNYVFTPRIRMSDGTIKALVNGEYYNPTDANLVMDITVIGVNEVTDLTINKQSYKPVQYPTYWRVEIPFPTKSPQRISITIEEYVRYESIVQPYPVMFKLVDKDTNKEYTYGDKIKIGSIINIIDVLYNPTSLYTIYGYKINGKGYYGWSQISSMDIDVTKTLTFTSDSVWLLSTAEPLFIYDPSMINNIGLKNLGYLPDISGQNRHLKLYNFSYEGMSGKDGYPVVFGANKTWTNIATNDGTIWNYELTPTSIVIYKSEPTGTFLIRTWAISNGVINSVTVPEFKIKISNLKDGEIVQYHYISSDNNSVVSSMSLKTNGIHTLPASVPIVTEDVSTNKSIGFTFKLNNNANVDGLTIEVLPDYKDSLYFNGITNTASVLNLDHGGKCLVTKINYKFNQESICIYDQRKNTLEENNKKFALLATQLTDIAYGSRLEGNTYINNVLNNYVRSSELENVEHVATLVSSVVEDSNTKAPIFGRANTDQNYAQFAMYRTILLPEVPNAADRAILNKWCGLPTGYLPKPEYYWDVTGKSNSDTATRNTIKNLGTAKPVASTSDEDAYSLQNKNVAYEGMSGYNGYPVVFGNQKTWNYLRPESDDWKYGLSPTSITIYKALSTSALLFTIVREVNGTIRAISIPSFKINVEGLKVGENIRYRYISSDDTSTYADITITENGQHELPASAPIEVTETTPNSFFVGFQVKLNDNTSAKGLIIKILPEYPNGLCLDGITNYIECANIPAFTDYTYIIKFKDFDDNLYNSCVQYKGPYKQGGSAFVQDYISTDHSKYQLSFGGSNKISNTISVGFCTKTNYNGSTINSGTNSDGLGIVIGKWASYRKMIFYKEMLWSKSINNTYHINMLRNLINNGGIIDLNDSIFDQTSNE